MYECGRMNCTGGLEHYVIHSHMMTQSCRMDMGGAGYNYVRVQNTTYCSKGGAA